MFSQPNRRSSHQQLAAAPRLLRLCGAFLVAALTSNALAQRATPLQLLCPDGTASDSFGNAAAIDGDTMVIGRRSLVNPARGAGAAYVYRWTGSGWTLEATLAPADLGPFDWFGESVAIYGDTIVVGTDGQNSSRGAAYVFHRNGTVWDQEAKLSASDGAVSDQFGFSVSIFGDTIAVGSPYRESSRGAAYLYKRTGATWKLLTTLTVSNSAAGSRFGSAVSISDGALVIGAPTADDVAIPASGAAYLFARSGMSWSLQAQLTAPGLATSDAFGSSVSISGESVVIGAPGSSSQRGAAYVFARSGLSWPFEGKLLAPDGADQDQFGSSVGIAGNSVIVGSHFDTVGLQGQQGSAYVFARSGTTWSQQTHLFAPGGLENDEFGSAVALSGDFAVVGAPGDSVGANTLQGSAWAFSRVGSSWIGPDLQLLASDGAASDQMGTSVAISGDYAIIGAANDVVNGNFSQGSAYLFARSGSTWIEEAHITSSDGAALDGFGFSVAISGTTAVVGARAANNSKGSAYIFGRVTSPSVNWVQKTKLVATDAATTGSFGFSVALSGTTAVVGSPFSSVGANSNQGATYVFGQASDVSWPQKAKLVASNGAGFDFFGVAVSISGTNLLVGASGALSNKGAVWAFTGSGASWTQQSFFAAADGATADGFGSAVSVFGDTVVVGAPNKLVGTNASQGAAYVFNRSGTVWNQVAKLAAVDGAPNAGFGTAVAFVSDTALIGSPYQSNGTTNIAGCAYVFTREGGTWSYAAKLAPIAGAAGDRYGRCVALSGSDFMAGAPMTSVGASGGRGVAYISNPAYNVSAFSLDDLNSTRNNTSPFISYLSVAAALVPAISGQTITATDAAWRMIGDIDTGNRALSLTGTADIRWPSTASVKLNSNSSLAATSGNALDIFGTLVLLANQTVSADNLLLGSRSATRIYGASMFSSGGAATIQGSLTLNTAATLNLNTPLARIDYHANFQIGQSSIVKLSGSFDCAIDSFSRFYAGGATMRLQGNGTEQTFEAMSTDLGPVAEGLAGFSAGRYPIATLQIASPAVVRIVDDRDNDGLGQSNCEAIYVDTLQIDAGAHLVNTGCSKIYYNTLINNGAVDVPSNLVRIQAACPSDFNGDGQVDDADFIIFVASYNILDCSDPSMPAGCPGDLDQSNLVDDADFVIFVAAYNELLCP